MKPQDLPTARDATLLDPVGPVSAFDVTALGPVSRAQPTSSAFRGAGRTTVLPRVEATADATHVVEASRPRFEPRRRLGEGGLGEVHAAHDHDIGREVAIKQLRREVEGPDAVARFVDEIRTVGALEHPNIVPIHDVGKNDDGSLYFVMPCVRGETLEAILERLQAGDAATHAHWTFERRLHVFRQLLDALAFAHKRGFVHRDIKPANVMVGSFGEVFLMDWGIAKPIGAPDRPVDPHSTNSPARAGTTSIGSVVGTPAYMSPEQAKGQPVDVRSDVYSLSVLLYELLCLKHYLDEAKTVEEVLDGVIHKAPVNASFVASRHQPPAPINLAWFVDKGMKKDPAKRYQSVAEMIARLEARDEGDIPVQCPITLTKRTAHLFERFVDHHPMVFMAGVALGAVGSITAAVLHFL